MTRGPDPRRLAGTPTGREPRFTGGGVVCAECRRPRRIKARGLCGPCYDRAWKQGRIGEFARLSSPVEGGLSTFELLESLGGAITYRQLDYWLRRGSLGGSDRAAGSGSRRYFDAREVAAVRVVVADYNAAREVIERIASGVRWAELLEGEVPGD